MYCNCVIMGGIFPFCKQFIEHLVYYFICTVVQVSANKCTFYPLLSIQGGINTTCSRLLLGLRRTGSNKLNNLRKCITTTA